VGTVASVAQASAAPGDLVAGKSSKESTTAVGSPNRLARGGFYCECLVRSVGPTESSPDIPILLKDPNGLFSERFFVAKGNQAYMLQTAIAAVTTGRHVNVQLADTTPYSEIINFYLLDY
jgi:hypothetical protein